MPALSFSTDADERVLAGVCAGIAQALGVDVTLVRVVFALLALAGGAGIVLYLALWMWSRSDRAWWAVALLLFAGPWLWRLALERDAERSARIRTEERADVATRVHDSVLQTLALIQRHADEPRRVASLARRQERELRGWLYADQPVGDDTSSLLAALSAVAADVEELYGVRVEIASAGDAPLDNALVLAAREAMANAAKFAGVEEIDVYAEVTDD